MRRERMQDSALERNLSSQNLFVGSSGVSEELRTYLSQIGASSAPVLIRGATGVGKEVVAKALHELSGRSTSGRFVGLNCSAIPSELLESELFDMKKEPFWRRQFLPGTLSACRSRHAAAR